MDIAHSRSSAIPSYLLRAGSRPAAALPAPRWKFAKPGALYIGRQQELTALLGGYQQAVNEQLRVILITGEPGIGKTRLLDEGVARMKAEGAIALQGTAFDGAGMPPYLPFLEALGQYIRTADAAVLKEQIGPAGPILAEFFPELTVRLGELPQRFPLSLEQSRLRLYEAVSDFLSAIASSRPLVLWFDDLHSADAASLDLLHHVARRLRNRRLLIIGSYRDGELDDNPVLRRAIGELNRLRLLTTITLSALTEDDIALLSTTYLDRPSSATLSRLLHTKSEGNPFFAEELLLDWIESGALADDCQPRELIARLESRLPLGIIAAVRQRLERLDPMLVDLLRVAALLGRTFDAPLLAAASDREVPVVEELLRTACHSRLLRLTQDERYSFTHDTIRDCLYGELSASRRHRLHSLIGGVLEDQTDQPDEHDLASLAYHFTRSGDRERGIHYSLRAAESALGVYAAGVALTHFSAALTLLDADDRRCGDLLLRLGDTALLAGVERDAEVAYAAALDWWTRAGAPLIAARAARGLGRAQRRLGELSMARASFEAALDLIGDRRVPEAVSAQVDLASLLGQDLGWQTAGIVHASRALAAARHLAQPDLEVQAGRTTGYLLVRANELDAGVKLLKESLGLASRTGQMVAAAGCCGFLAQAACLSVDFTGAGEMARLWDKYAQMAGSHHRSRYLYSWQAFLFTCRGQWADAEHALAQSLQILDGVPNPGPQIQHRTMHGFLNWQRGNLGEAERMLHDVAAALRPQASITFFEMLGLLALTLLALDKRHEAQGALAELEALLDAPGMQNALSAGSVAAGTVLGCLTVAALEMGDHKRAGSYYPRLLTYQGQHHWFLTDRLLAAIEVTQKNWAAAEEHLARAVDVARREGLRPELARVLVVKAELEVARGGMECAMRARQLLGEARDLFRNLSMEREAVKVLDVLRSLPSQPGPVAESASPGKLTEREITVLRLVVAGKKNRQIAAELFMSEKTVANHLTAIYTKTNTDNRAGAASFALRHGLA